MTPLFLIFLVQLIMALVHGDVNALDQQRVGSSLNTKASQPPASYEKQFCAHDDVAAVCLACAAEAGGPSVTSCCSQGLVFNTCADRVLLQLLGSDDEGLQRDNNGKTEMMVSNIKAAIMGKQKFFPGERIDEITEGDMAEEEAFGEEEKRGRSPFLGKRRSPFLGKRRSPFLGKRNDKEKEEEEKRGRSPFLGKRRMPFLG